MNLPRFSALLVILLYNVEGVVWISARKRMRCAGMIKELDKFLLYNPAGINH